MESEKEKIWKKQGEALRSPSELFGTSYENASINEKSLSYEASTGFEQLIRDLNITLIISREYENLLIALSPDSSDKITQTFFHVPHPSGVAVDRDKDSLYVASTRNPNQIIEFKTSSKQLEREKIPANNTVGRLLPSRVKYYPGEYYFHDLAIVGNELYANAVGLNSVVKIDMSTTDHESPIWWPKCVEENGKLNAKANYIQLNSIAAGKDLGSSFFTASSSSISTSRPGDLDYSVDKQGVLFSGETRTSVGGGLTRPHSARTYKGKVWVANSGYGQVGYMDENGFNLVFQLEGWTRGMCFVNDILFVGVSRVLPRFKAYAPGLDVSSSQSCGITAFDMNTKTKLGEVNFPYGNQIFAIDFMNRDKCSGFPFQTVENNSDEAAHFSSSLI